MLDFNPPEFRRLRAESKDTPEPANDLGEAASRPAHTAANGLSGPVVIPDDLQPDRRSRFIREDFDTVEPKGSAWRVKGLWPHSGVCFVSGVSGAGKSFWTLEALVNLCRGLPVIGNRSYPCGAIYVAAEDPNGVRGRFKQMRERIGPLGGRLELIGGGANLTDPEDVEELRLALSEARKGMAAKGFDLGVVAIDTLSASTPGADENTAKDMQPVLTALQSMAEDLGLLVLVVAHPNKSDPTGVRGWSGLTFNADGLIVIEGRGEGVLRTGLVHKVKNGSDGQRFAYHLRKVEVGRDYEGDPITTRIVEEAAVPEGGKGARPKLSGRQSLVLKAVHMCLEAGEGSRMPLGPGIPPGTVGVHRDAVKRRAMLEGFAGSDASEASVRRMLNATITDLIGKNVLRGQLDLLWPLKEAGEA